MSVDNILVKMPEPFRLFPSRRLCGAGLLRSALQASRYETAAT